MADETTLTTRALNRALLTRQMLLARESIPVVQAVERLAGLQAQLARPPFIGLWSRIQNFKREALLTEFKRCKVVRATMMRATIHVVSAKDYLAFRCSIQPALTAAMKSVVKSREPALDEQAVLAVAERCFKTRPQTFAELRAAFSNDFPNVDERRMAYLARTSIPLVMVPDASEYGFTNSTFTAAESWLDRAIPAEDRTADLVLRYLAAFGPATVRDAQTWSGLSKLEPVFQALRPKLRVFRDERNRELFDLPKAPRPDESIPAPVRFLPAFDNLILAHADRTRIIADEHRPRVTRTKNLQILPTFLLDGFVAGTWDVVCSKKLATLAVSPFEPVRRATKLALESEGEHLARFLCPDAARFEVRLS